MIQSWQFEIKIKMDFKWSILVIEWQGLLIELKSMKLNCAWSRETTKFKQITHSMPYYYRNWFSQCKLTESSKNHRKQNQACSCHFRFFCSHVTESQVTTPCEQIEGHSRPIRELTFVWTLNYTCVDGCNASDAVSYCYFMGLGIL